MPISIRLPEDIEKRLNALAAETGRTKTFYVVEAIKEHLEDMEDMALPEQVMKRVRSGEERTYTLEEVKRDLGLEG